MSNLNVPNIICFQTQKQLANLNNIQLLYKCFDWFMCKSFCACENLFACTLHAHLSLCTQFAKPCISCNLKKEKKNPLQMRKLICWSIWAQPTLFWAIINTYIIAIIILQNPGQLAFLIYYFQLLFF